MFRYAVITFLCLSLVSVDVIAQNNTAFFQIGNQKIQFQYNSVINVLRTVSDTVLDCKRSNLKQIVLGDYKASIYIHPDSIVSFKREVFNDKGCVWSRLTNDEVNEYGKVQTRFHFMNDSAVKVKRPCIRRDTVMQINPITLEEEVVVQIDSESIVKYNLGTIEKGDFKYAIITSFGLNGAKDNLRLSNVSFWVLNETCSFISIDYADFETIKFAEKVISELDSGSKILIDEIHFEENNGRIYYGYTYSVAYFSIR